MVHASYAWPGEDRVVDARMITSRLSILVERYATD
jgi:hypothetical protein